MAEGGGEGSYNSDQFDLSAYMREEILPLQLEVEMMQSGVESELGPEWMLEEHPPTYLEDSSMSNSLASSPRYLPEFPAPAPPVQDARIQDIIARATGPEGITDAEAIQYGQILNQSGLRLDPAPPGAPPQNPGPSGTQQRSQVQNQGQQGAQPQNPGPSGTQQRSQVQNQGQQGAPPQNPGPSGTRQVMPLQNQGPQVTPPPQYSEPRGIAQVTPPQDQSLQLTPLQNPGPIFTPQASPVQNQGQQGTPPLYNGPGGTSQRSPVQNQGQQGTPPQYPGPGGTPQGSPVQNQGQLMQNSGPLCAPLQNNGRPVNYPLASSPLRPGQNVNVNLSMSPIGSPLGQMVFFPPLAQNQSQIQNSGLGSQHGQSGGSSQPENENSQHLNTNIQITNSGQQGTPPQYPGPGGIPQASPFQNQSQQGTPPQNPGPIFTPQASPVPIQGQKGTPPQYPRPGGAPQRSPVQNQGQQGTPPQNPGPGGTPQGSPVEIQVQKDTPPQYPGPDGTPQRLPVQNQGQQGTSPQNPGPICTPQASPVQIQGQKGSPPQYPGPGGVPQRSPVQNQGQQGTPLQYSGPRGIAQVTQLQNQSQKGTPPQYPGPGGTQQGSPVQNQGQQGTPPQNPGPGGTPQGSPVQNLGQQGTPPKNPGPIRIPQGTPQQSTGTGSYFTAQGSPMHSTGTGTYFTAQGSPMHSTGTGTYFTAQGSPMHSTGPYGSPQGSLMQNSGPLCAPLQRNGRPANFPLVSSPLRPGQNVNLDLSMSPIGPPLGQMVFFPPLVQNQSQNQNSGLGSQHGQSGGSSESENENSQHLNTNIENTNSGNYFSCNSNPPPPNGAANGHPAFPELNRNPQSPVIINYRQRVVPEPDQVLDQRERNRRRNQIPPPRLPPPAAAAGAAAPPAPRQPIVDRRPGDLGEVRRFVPPLPEPAPFDIEYANRLTIAEQLVQAIRGGEEPIAVEGANQFEDQFLNEFGYVLQAIPLSEEEWEQQRHLHPNHRMYRYQVHRIPPGEMPMAIENRLQRLVPLPDDRPPRQARPRVPNTGPRQAVPEAPIIIPSPPAGLPSQIGPSHTAYGVLRMRRSSPQAEPAPVDDEYEARRAVTEQTVQAVRDGAPLSVEEANQVEDQLLNEFGYILRVIPPSVEELQLQRHLNPNQRNYRYQIHSIPPGEMAMANANRRNRLVPRQEEFFSQGQMDNMMARLVTNPISAAEAEGYNNDLRFTDLEVVPASRPQGPSSPGNGWYEVQRRPDCAAPTTATGPGEGQSPEAFVRAPTGIPGPSFWPRSHFVQEETLPAVQRTPPQPAPGTVDVAHREQRRNFEAIIQLFEQEPEQLFSAEQAYQMEEHVLFDFGYGLIIVHPSHEEWQEQRHLDPLQRRYRYRLMPIGPEDQEVAHVERRERLQAREETPQADIDRLAKLLTESPHTQDEVNTFYAAMLYTDFEIVRVDRPGVPVSPGRAWYEVRRRRNSWTAVPADQSNPGVAMPATLRSPQSAPQPAGVAQRARADAIIQSFEQQAQQELSAEQAYNLEERILFDFGYGLQIIHPSHEEWQQQRNLDPLQRRYRYRLMPIGPEEMARERGNRRVRLQARSETSQADIDRLAKLLTESPHTQDEVNTFYAAMLYTDFEIVPVDRPGMPVSPGRAWYEVRRRQNSPALPADQSNPGATMPAVLRTPQSAPEPVDDAQQRATVEAIIRSFERQPEQPLTAEDAYRTEERILFDFGYGLQIIHPSHEEWQQQRHLNPLQRRYRYRLMPIRPEEMDRERGRRHDRLQVRELSQDDMVHLGLLLNERLHTQAEADNFNADMRYTDYEIVPVDRPGMPASPGKAWYEIRRRQNSPVALPADQCDPGVPTPAEQRSSSEPASESDNGSYLERRDNAEAILQLFNQQPEQHFTAEEAYQIDENVLFDFGFGLSIRHPSHEEWQHQRHLDPLQRSYRYVIFRIRPDQQEFARGDRRERLQAREEASQEDIDRLTAVLNNAPRSQDQADYFNTAILYTDFEVVPVDRPGMPVGPGTAWFEVRRRRISPVPADGAGIREGPSPARLPPTVPPTQSPPRVPTPVLPPAGIPSPQVCPAPTSGTGNIVGPSLAPQTPSPQQVPLRLPTPGAPPIGMPGASVYPAPNFGSGNLVGPSLAPQTPSPQQVPLKVPTPVVPPVGMPGSTFGSGNLVGPSLAPQTPSPQQTPLKVPTPVVQPIGMPGPSISPAPTFSTSNRGEPTLAPSPLALPPPTATPRQTPPRVPTPVAPQAASEVRGIPSPSVRPAPTPSSQQAGRIIAETVLAVSKRGLRVSPENATRYNNFLQNIGFRLVPLPHTASELQFQRDIAPDVLSYRYRAAELQATPPPPLPEPWLQVVNTNIENIPFDWVQVQMPLDAHLRDYPITFREAYRIDQVLRRNGYRLQRVHRRLTVSSEETGSVVRSWYTIETLDLNHPNLFTGVMVQRYGLDLPAQSPSSRQGQVQGQRLSDSGMRQSQLQNQHQQQQMNQDPQGVQAALNGPRSPESPPNVLNDSSHNFTYMTTPETSAGQETMSSATRSIGSIGTPGSPPPIVNQGDAPGQNSSRVGPRSPSQGNANNSVPMVSPTIPISLVNGERQSNTSESVGDTQPKKSSQQGQEIGSCTACTPKRLTSTSPGGSKRVSFSNEAGDPLPPSTCSSSQSEQPPLVQMPELQPISPLAPSKSAQFKQLLEKQTKNSEPLNPHIGTWSLPQSSQGQPPVASGYNSQTDSWQHNQTYPPAVSNAGMQQQGLTGSPWQYPPQTAGQVSGTSNNGSRRCLNEAPQVPPVSLVAGSPPGSQRGSFDPNRTYDVIVPSQQRLETSPVAPTAAAVFDARGSPGSHKDSSSSSAPSSPRGSPPKEPRLSGTAGPVSPSNAAASSTCSSSQQERRLTPPFSTTCASGSTRSEADAVQPQPTSADTSKSLTVENPGPPEGTISKYNCGCNRGLPCTCPTCKFRPLQPERRETL